MKTDLLDLLLEIKAELERILAEKEKIDSLKDCLFRLGSELEKEDE